MAGTIEVTSGVSAFTGEPFCHVQWGKESGQLTPNEVRQMALLWLGAAEAAEQDAIVFQLIREELEFPPELAAQFIQRMRAIRDAQDDTRGKGAGQGG